MVLIRGSDAAPGTLSLPECTRRLPGTAPGAGTVARPATGGDPRADGGRGARLSPRPVRGSPVHSSAHRRLACLALSTASPPCGASPPRRPLGPSLGPTRPPHLSPADSPPCPPRPAAQLAGVTVRLSSRPKTMRLAPEAPALRGPQRRSALRPNSAAKGRRRAGHYPPFSSLPPATNPPPRRADRRRRAQGWAPWTACSTRH